MGRREISARLPTSHMGLDPEIRFAKNEFVKKSHRRAELRMLFSQKPGSWTKYWHGLSFFFSAHHA